LLATKKYTYYRNSVKKYYYNEAIYDLYFLVKLRIVICLLGSRHTFASLRHWRM